MIVAEYLLRANICLCGLFGLYWLLFRRHTFFGLNRAYLLLTLLASALLPLIELPAPTVQAVALPVVTLPALPVTVLPAAPAGPSLAEVLWWVYGAGVAGGIGWLLLGFWRLARLIRAGERLALPDCTLVLLNDEQVAPFSFFRFLVMSRADFAQHPDPILRHEQVHIRQWHSADVLLAELVKIGCWFNPVAWLIPKSLQQTHEFLADQSATDADSRADYARFLVGYALGTGPEPLTNSFLDYSSLKTRIIMLQAKPTHRRALLGYALALPLALGLLFCTQQNPDEATKPTSTARQRTDAPEPAVVGEIFAVVDEQPEFKGGMKELYEYLGDNMKYPASAERANIGGTVFVSFVVNTEGEIADVKLLKGIGFGCDEEAMRVIQEMPRWTPARHKGQVVNVKYNLPIRFQLREKKHTDNQQTKTLPLGVETPSLRVFLNWKELC